MSLRATAVTGVVAAALGCSTMGLAAAAETPGDLVVPGDFVAGRVLVKYAPDVDSAAQVALERGFGARAAGEIPQLDVRILEVPEGAEVKVVQAFARSGKVEFAERDAVGAITATPNDPYWPQQWGPAKVGAPQTWDTTTGTAAVIVAVLDTGTDLSHPDLQDRLTGGYDFINSDPDPSDDHGHGTAVSSIAVASTDNGAGIAGMCWSCTLMPVKVADASGSAPWSAVASGVTWATDRGATVISISLAGSSGGSTLQSAVSYAHSRGVMVVAGAGNNGSTSPMYPAAYSEVLAVAGSTSSDSLYSWSNRGPWVSVAAPGCDYAAKRGGGYASVCGTSAATPVVSGALSLLRAARPHATGAEILTAVQNGVVPIGDVVEHGRLDAARSLTLLGQKDPVDPGPSPAAEPTASPTPTYASEPTAEESSTVTATFSGSLNNRNPTRSFAVRSGAGPLHAAVTFSRSATLRLTLLDRLGNQLAAATGGSPVRLQADVTAGEHTLVVSDGSRASFSLEVRHERP